MQGQPHFLTGDLPEFKVPQSPAKTEDKGKHVTEKVSKVRRRRYIAVGLVLSLTHMFYVAKGLDDIQMVYSGTSCRLNDALWSLHFGLPTVQHTLQSLLPGYFQCDMDAGEMFLNFHLHADLQLYAGVDVTHVRSPPGRSRRQEVG